MGNRTNPSDIGIATSYSSALTNGSASSPLNGVNTTYYYQAIQVNASITGNYTFTSSSLIDTYGYLYINSFDPLNYRNNLLAADDDTGGSNQFQITFLLQARSIYVLVFTTYNQRQTAPFTLTVRGPAQVTLIRVDSPASTTTATRPTTPTQPSTTILTTTSPRLSTTTSLITSSAKPTTRTTTITSVSPSTTTIARSCNNRTDQPICPG